MQYHQDIQESTDLDREKGTEMNSETREKVLGVMREVLTPSGHRTLEYRMTIKAISLL